MISNIRNDHSPSFQAARLNIIAMSDNHGNVHTLPLLAETIKNNAKDIFIKSNDSSTKNILAIVGDWFINPSKKGFLTQPNLTNGDIQLRFLNKIISYVRELSGKSDNFDTVFAMGNHDLDGGDKFMYKVMRNTKMKTLITNVDEKNSIGLKELKDNSNVVKSFVYKIPDDKNPNLDHNVLFVGVTIPSMKFYNPGLLKKMEFLDDCNLKDSDLTPEKLIQTIEAVKKEVDKFKKENPKGAVVLLSHTGNNISKMIVDKVPQVNIVLNGHDHKNSTMLTGKTNINSLGKDNEIFKALNLYFDDDGNLSNINMNTFFSRTTVKDNLDKNPVQKLLNQSFVEDMEPMVTLHDISGRPIELDYGEITRYQNSYLANFLTSAVNRSVRRICDDPDIILGIQSSIIRGGLKNKSNNLDIMKIFDGVSEDLSDVHVGKVKGDELVGLIVENVLGNLKAPKRNTIIQWSDIQVNRTLIGEIITGKSNKKMDAAIKVRNEKTNEFEPIDLDKDYKIAIGRKYLVKDDIVWAKRIRDRFVSLDKTYDQLLRSYLSSDDVNYQIKITEKVKEQRII